MQITVIVLTSLKQCISSAVIRDKCSKCTLDCTLVLACFGSDKLNYHSSFRRFDSKILIIK